MLNLNQIHNERRPLRNILIVEDDLCLQTMVFQSLKVFRPRPKVDWVTSAEQASRLLGQKRFDLILADYILEGQFTGVDLWNYCMDEYPGTPFVMISGLEVPKFFALFQGHSICPPFLPKPFYPKEFREVIEEVL